MVDFARHLSNLAGVSIIMEQSLDRSPVSIDVVEQPVGHVLSYVARRLGREVTRTGSLYFVGQLTEADKGVLVRRVQGLDSKGVQQAVSVLLSPDGKIASFSNGLLVVGDRIDSLSKIEDMLRQLETQESPVWCVQLLEVVYTEEAAEVFRLDVAPTVQLAAAYASGPVLGGTALPAAAFNGGDVSSMVGISALLEASKTETGVAIGGRAMFLLADGETGRLKNGERFPILTTTTLTETRTQSEQVSFEQVGTEIEIGCREDIQGEASIEVSYSVSDILGMVEGYPRIANKSIDTKLRVSGSGSFLVGEYKRQTQKRQASSWLTLGQSRTDAEELVQVWVVACRVGERERPGAVESM